MDINFEKEIENITIQIVQKYGPEKTILFGSAARADMGLDSDADFLVIKGKTPYYGADRIRELSRLIERNIPVDFLVYKPEEFEFALANYNEGKPFLALLCFHFQQSAEKYLKAFIIAYGQEFKKTHDLHTLLKTCIKTDSSLKQLNADCEHLNTFYIETRYPVHWPTHFTRE